MAKEFKKWLDEFVAAGQNPVDVPNWPRGGGTGGNIEYHTTEYYNIEHKTEIYPAGTILIYSDYKTDAQGKLVPGVKVSDGLAYVIDLPFITEQEEAALEIADEALEQSTEALEAVNAVQTLIDEKETSWDNKITCSDEPVQNETLVLTRN